MTSGNTVFSQSIIYQLDQYESQGCASVAWTNRVEAVHASNPSPLQRFAFIVIKGGKRGE